MGKHLCDSEKYTRRVDILAFINEYWESHIHSPSIREISEGAHINGTETVHTCIKEIEKDDWITSDKFLGGNRQARTIRVTALGIQILKDENRYNGSKTDHGGIAKAELPGSNKPTGNKFPVPTVTKQFFDVSYAIPPDEDTHPKSDGRVEIPILNVIFATFGISLSASDFSVSGLSPEYCVKIEQDKIPNGLDSEGLFAVEVSGDSMIDAGIKHGDYVIVKQTGSPDNGDICIVWFDHHEVTLKYFYKVEKGFRLVPANSELQPREYPPSEDLFVQGKVVLVLRN